LVFVNALVVEALGELDDVRGVEIDDAETDHGCGSRVRDDDAMVADAVRE
jgi:hypothetical protein